MCYNYKSKFGFLEKMEEHEAERGKIDTRLAIPFVPLPLHLNHTNAIEFKLHISKIILEIHI